MRNFFYFVLKAFFVLKVFKFFYDILVMQEKQGDQKDKVNFKFMTSQNGLQTIAIGILRNISQSKGDQATKFGQLIKYNKRNILLQKLYGE